jgi:hypothetical protein
MCARVNDALLNATNVLADGTQTTLGVIDFVDSVSKLTAADLKCKKQA